ncbi:MAG TPA: hypothetical protein PKK42_25105, partial [Leptospiraceae bacterium]|nr:hypothetical protein [Leptospiraceae bacterium]
MDWLDKKNTGVMKFIILVLLINAFSCSIKSTDQNPIPAKKEDLQLKKSTVIFAGNGKWKPEFNAPGWNFTFYKKEEYEQFFAGEGSCLIKGKYKQINNTIQLFRKKTENCSPFSESEFTTCNIVETPESLYSLFALKCNSNLYYSIEQKRNTGDRVIIGRVLHEIIYPNDYETTDNVFFRQGPGVNFEPINCYYSETETQIERRNVLHKNYRLYVIAKTVDKTQVGKFTNHWYYVKPEQDFYGRKYCSLAEGWVFGEY